MLLRLGVCALTLVAITGCKSKPTLEGPCDSKEMEMLRSASKSVNAEDRATITTAGLAEACENKLPSGAAAGMKALGSVSPADRATIIAGVLAENMSFTKLACPDFEALAKRSDFLYTGCKYERFDLLVEKNMEPAELWWPSVSKRLAREMFLGEVAEPPAPVPAQ